MFTLGSTALILLLFARFCFRRRKAARCTVIGDDSLIGVVGRGRRW